MGGLPLLGVAKPTLNGFFGKRDAQVAGMPPSGGLFSSTFGSTAAAMRQAVAKVPGTVSAEPPYSPPTTATEYRMTNPVQSDSHLVDKLERLSAMHESGSLSDAEFEAAKKRLIEGSG
jgi:hypothetical protein